MRKRSSSNNCAGSEFSSTV
ncbi:hypothetical protein YPPY93_2517, partial [Yersinia pestis PY-93]